MILRGVRKMVLRRLKIRGGAEWRTKRSRRGPRRWSSGLLRVRMNFSLVARSTRASCIRRTRSACPAQTAQSPVAPVSKYKS